MIAIDGPAASGKGTIAQGVAAALGYRYLDSGSLYRLVALQAARQNVSFDDEPRLAALADGLDLSFADGRTFLSGQDVTQQIRAEEVSAMASKVAVLPRVRTALLTRHRAFRAPPGLVAEGRDMGTVVFPDATFNCAASVIVCALVPLSVYPELLKKSPSALIALSTLIL